MSYLESADEKLNDRTIALRWTAGILIIAAAVRFAWLFHDGFRIDYSEAFNVASAFATRGELADAYGPGSGLTAHVSPGMPLLVGTIYRWLGVGTRWAEFALACLSLTFIYVNFLALDAAFKRLGAAPIARIGAIALLALVPLNFWLEMSAFRVWEGAIAAAGIALCLDRALELDAAERRPSWLDLVALAAGVALLSLFSLPAAVACSGILGWLALRKRGWMGLVGAAAASIALFLAFSYPWALRNEAIFGEKVWTRTNFGMNFALGFHDAAIDPIDEKKALEDRLNEVAPFEHPKALAAMKAAGGEVPYNKLMIAQTEEWIRQHPLDALKIAARHAWEFYFPSRWLLYTDSNSVAALKQAVMWTISFVGFVGLAVGLGRRDWRYVYVAAPLLLLMLPYVLGDPVLRYRYPVNALLTFLAADLGWRTMRRVSERPVGATASVN